MAAMSLTQSLRLSHRGWRYRLGSNRGEVQFVRSRIGPGDAVIDLGAHKGAFVYWMRSRVGSSGRVIAFEPQPPLASALRSIIAHRRWANVELNELAVSDTPGKLMFGVPGSDPTSPGARLVPSEESDHRDYNATFEVDVVTLDEFLADRPKPIRFIKCDVEGVELSVFKGAKSLLEKDHPDLMFECEARHLDDGRVEDVLAFLQSLGYTGRFFQHGKLRPVEEFSVEEHQAMGPDGTVNHPDYCNNFAFTHER